MSFSLSIRPMPRTMYSLSLTSTDFGADVVVAALDRHNHILQRDVVGAQFHGSTSIWYSRTNPPTLATSATPGTELSLVLDVPVLNGVECSAVVWTFDRVPEDLPHAGGIWPHHRRDAGRAGSCEARFSRSSTRVRAK